MINPLYRELYRERRRKRFTWLASAIIGLAILWGLPSGDVFLILCAFFLIVQLDIVICPFKDALDDAMLRREIESINKTNRAAANDKNTRY